MQRASRKESASIPGHASRYAAERQALWGTIFRVLHHVTHFRPEKMATASSHMNTQAGNWEAKQDNRRRQNEERRPANDNGRFRSVMRPGYQAGFRSDGNSILQLRV